MKHIHAETIRGKRLKPFTNVNNYDYDNQFPHYKLTLNSHLNWPEI
jgi:hypothetical protein